MQTVVKSLDEKETAKRDSWPKRWVLLKPSSELSVRLWRSSYDLLVQNEETTFRKYILEDLEIFNRKSTEHTCSSKISK